MTMIEPNLEKLIFIAFITIIIFSASQAAAAGVWPVSLEDWTYRKQITLNNTGSDLTNYQLKFTIYRSTGTDSGFTVYLGTKCESDYDDIRFVMENGTDCPYWIETSSSSSATVWVKVPSIPAGTSNIYIYYGNSAATAVSSGDNTFIFFDDFPGSSLNTSKWTILSGNGNIYQSGGKLRMDYTGSQNNDWWTSGRNQKVLKLNSLPSDQVEIVVTLDSYTDVSNAEAGMAVYQDDTHGYRFGRCRVTGNGYYLHRIGTADVAYISSTTLPAYLKIRKTSSSYSFFVDSGKTGTWSKCGGDYSDVTFNTVALYGLENADVNLSVVMDNFFIRKFVANEPSVSAWGSEEIFDIIPDFYASPTSGQNPLDVYFFDNSTGYIVIDNYNWSFGDGTPNSTDQNPAHTYTIAGYHDVTLTLTNTTYSYSKSITKTAYITSWNMTVDFFGTPTSGANPLSVQFFDASDHSPLAITYEWSFGDGTPNSTDQNPAHTYTTSGTYNVSLTITNTTFSVINSTKKTGYITVTPNIGAPIADFTVSATCGNVGDTFYFADYSTGGSLYAWNWSFGDGTYSNSRNTVHQYSSNGTYNVSLTVWGAYGSDTKTRYNFITIPCATPTPIPTPTPTPTGTPPIQGEIPQARIPVLGFMVLAWIDLGLMLYTFIDNENRNYMHVYSAVIAVILSFFLSVSLTNGFITEPHVLTDQSVTVNSSVMSTYLVKHVEIVDTGLSWFFGFIGVMMLIICILAVIEAVRENTEEVI